MPPECIFPILPIVGSGRQCCDWGGGTCRSRCALNWAKGAAGRQATGTFDSDRCRTADPAVGDDCNGAQRVGHRQQARETVHVPIRPALFTGRLMIAPPKRAAKARPGAVSPPGVTSSAEPDRAAAERCAAAWRTGFRTYPMAYGHANGSSASRPLWCTRAPVSRTPALTQPLV